MDEKEKRDPALDRAMEIFKGRDGITVSAIMRECKVGYNHAAEIFDRLEEMGYSVTLERSDPESDKFLRDFMKIFFGRNSAEIGFDHVKGAARKCSREEIGKLLADTPRKREDMTVSLGEYSAFGSGVRVFIDCGKDIAYRRVSSRGDDSYYLLSIDIPKFVQRLSEITASWEHEMVDESILDGICYHVTVSKDGETTDEYQGQNKFPDNYLEFKALLRSLD